MSKQFWIIVVIVVVGLVGIFTITGQPASQTTNSKPSEHIEGLGKDGITLVEYGDYQCPYCGEYYSTLKQVVSLYYNQIYFQFRNFPLTSIHPNAFAGARATEAASLMGKFWQMHDLLYQTNQDYYNTNGANPGWIGTTNPLPVFDQYASSLGLNVNKFNQLYNSSQVNNVIIADENAGNSLNIDATPTFIINGKQVQIADSLSAFEKVINAEIQQVKSKGTASVKVNGGTTAQSKAPTTTK